ncbi:hypothetical protein BH23GEM9_BH23GEM9_06900 [soil metagenome]
MTQPEIVRLQCVAERSVRLKATGNIVAHDPPATGGDRPRWFHQTCHLSYGITDLLSTAVCTVRAVAAPPKTMPAFSMPNVVMSTT